MVARESALMSPSHLDHHHPIGQCLTSPAALFPASFPRRHPPEPAVLQAMKMFVLLCVVASVALAVDLDNDVIAMIGSAYLFSLSLPSPSLTCLTPPIHRRRR